MRGGGLDVMYGPCVCALDVARHHGHHECVQQLIEAGANVNSARENGATALYAAAQQGHNGHWRAVWRVPSGAECERSGCDEWLGWATR